MLLFLSFAATRARAEAPIPAATPGNREQARKLAGQGFEALQRKDYAAAEELFRRADELVHAPTLELDHARSLVGLGKFVEGHEQYEQVIREGVAPNAPWQWKQAVVEAQAELATVNRRMAWLTIKVHGGNAAAVHIDGEAVPGAALGVPRATNPGVRVLSASAEGFLSTDRSITLSEGQTAEIELKLERDPNAPAPVEHATTLPVVVVMEAAPLPPPRPDRTLPVILLSAGAATIVVGAVTGVLALNVRSELKGMCGGRACVPTNQSEYDDYSHKRDRYRGLGTASGVAFGAGAAAALGGAALWFFGQSSSGAAAPETRGTHPTLQVGLGSLFVSGAF